MVDIAYEIASKLGGAKRVGSEWRCTCPLHDDKHASCDVKRGDKQPVILICRAGCDKDALFRYVRDAGYLPVMKRQQHDDPIETYYYTDEHGSVIYEKLRFQNKVFKVRHTDKSGRITWGANGIEKPLYLRHTLNDIKGKQVILVEGEKDADFVWSHYEMIVTSPPNGTSSWKKDYAKVFVGADVVICPDNDAPGLKMGQLAYDDIKPYCNTIKTVIMPHGKDVSDWAGTRDEFVKLISGKEITETKMEFVSGDDLADNAKPPTYLIDDILESDSHGIMAGQSGAYKSFMALKMAHCICTGNDFFGKRVFESGKVVYVCGEGEGNLSRRIKALKLEFGDFNGNLIVKKGRIRIDNVDDIRELNLYIQEVRPSLVIFDTFSSMNSETNENDNSEVGSALSMIHSALQNGYTTSMIVHHYGKDNDRGMRGASAFKNNTDFVMVMTRAEGERRVILSCDKTKDGEAFEDILCEAKIVDLGLIRQNGDSSSSLVLVDCNGEGIFRKSGRPNQNDTKFWQIYDECLDEFPIEIMGQIGVDKKFYLQKCKSVIGGNDDSFRMASKRFISSKIKASLLIEINGILVKAKLEQK